MEKRHKNYFSKIPHEILGMMNWVKTITKTPSSS